MNISIFRFAFIFAVGAVAGLHPAPAAVYVANYGGRESDGPPSVLVFPPDAIGDTAPVRVIAGDQTGLVGPAGTAVDTVNDELYVIDGGGQHIRVFTLGASGNAAPIRVLGGDVNSGLGYPRKIVIDTAHDELIVSSLSSSFPFSNSIRVYARTADGDVAPLRVIEGPDTLLHGSGDLVLDAAHDEIIVAGTIGVSPETGALLTFARSADGNVAPIRTVSGPQTMLGPFTNYLVHDAVSDELYAATAPGGFRPANGFAVYPRAANGDVAPRRWVTGPNTGLSEIIGFAFDAANRRLTVSEYNPYNAFDPSILRVFEHTDDGDASPVLTVSGPNTALLSPFGSFAIDAAGGFAGEGPALFASRASFDAVAGDPSAFTVEDFEDGNVGGGEAQICAEPVSSTSADACFPPGHVAGGFTLTSQSGGGIALVGDAFFGDTSAIAGAATVADSTIVTPEPGTTAVSLDAYAISGANSDVIISIYDPDGRLVSFTAVRPSDPYSPVFVGATSPTGLARIEFHLPNENGVVMIDNLRLRRADALFADGFERLP